MTQLSDRVALVTGASRGIGKAIATRLAAEGASVAICSRPKPGMTNLTLDAARNELASLGGQVVAFEADLSDPDLDREGLIARVEAQLGPVDILVNNAAAGGFRSFMDWTDEQIERAIQVNFWAPWKLIRGVLPGMRDRGEGWIINISSATAQFPQGPPFPTSLPSVAGTIYGGSKSFLDRWSVSLAAEVQPDGIAVNVLSPQAAAATEVLVAHAAIPDHLMEPLETMAEATLVLATADPQVLTGQVTYSLELLHELNRRTMDLHGETELVEWAPEHLTERVQAALASRAAKGDRGSANPYKIPGGPQE